MSTTIDADDLTVPGTAMIEDLQITGGTPAVGKTLISDAVGNMSLAFLPSGAFAGVLASGSLALGNGVDSGSVTGLTLAFTPTIAILTVRKPAAGLTIAASAVAGSITAAGFDFDLTGLTDATTYFLDYILI